MICPDTSLSRRQVLRGAAGFIAVLTTQSAFVAGAAAAHQQIEPVDETPTVQREYSIIGVL